MARRRIGLRVGGTLFVGDWTTGKVDAISRPAGRSRPIICFAASCVPKNALFRLISITRSYWSSVVSRTDVRVSMPALFTMTSSRPNAFTVASISACSSSTLLTSAFTPMAWPPSPTICCSSASVASGSTTKSMTTSACWAASASAMALPMPLFPR